MAKQRYKLDQLLYIAAKNYLAIIDYPTLPLMKTIFEPLGLLLP
jgi:hypothetical protein